MIITEGFEYTINSNTQDLHFHVAKDVYEYHGDIHGWLDTDDWKKHKLIFDLDKPVIIKGDLLTKSWVHTNYPIKVKGEDRRGDF